MRFIPFRKKNPGKFEVNQEKIQTLTQQTYQDLSSDPDSDANQINGNLLHENFELKEKLELLEQEINHNLLQGGTHVIEIGKSGFNIISKVRVIPDTSKLQYNNKVVDIQAGPLVGRLAKFGKDRQFIAYFVEQFGEYTYNPIDLTQLEVKKRNEKTLQLQHAMTEAHFAIGLTKDLGSMVKKWIEYIPWIVFMIVIIGFLIFMAQYNLVKA